MRIPVEWETIVAGGWLYEVKVRAVHDTSGSFSQGDITHRPSPTITVGVGGSNSGHFRIEYYVTDDPPAGSGDWMNGGGAGVRNSSKPPFLVPSMNEIAAIPWNGYTAVSTFSGCGGSSLGYKMAGFRVLWANEFVPAAQDTYRANHPDTILDTRDIRTVQPEEVLDAIGMQPGDLDLMDGSPPCASFSMAGNRERNWGQVKLYSQRMEQRTDDLFFEYARLVTGVQPKVFIAENVAGLVQGVAKGYFIEILTALKNCGYTVSAKVLDAQWLGVPQMRRRVIFVGVRNDLVERFGVRPVHPKPLTYRYNVSDALPWVQRIRYGGRVDNWKPAKDNPAGTVVQADSSTSPTAYLSSGGWVEVDVEAEAYFKDGPVGTELDSLRPGQKSQKYFLLRRADPNTPSQTIVASGGHRSSPSMSHPTERRKFSISELRRICAFPDDFILTGTYVQQWERLGRAVPPVMMMHIAKTVRSEILDRCRPI